MSSIGKKIKKYLYSSAAPESLFALYFNRQAKRNRQQLNERLDTGEDLIERMSEEEKEYWMGRINDVLDGPDNKDIPRGKNAGKIINGELIMHNGIRVDPLSYYSFPLLKMLMDNKGVHEPQEEKIFQEVLNSLDPDTEKTMLELGSYWAFYSMWFQQINKKTNCYMVEPDRRNLLHGKNNFKLNGFKGTFMHAGIGKAKDTAMNIISVDEICAKHKIDFVDILHSDIQGYELDMLHGSEKILSANKVGYVFISTHSNELHYDCLKLLKEKYKFSLVAEADLDNTYSWDGIIVMKAPNYPGIEKVTIAKKKRS